MDTAASRRELAHDQQQQQQQQQQQSCAEGGCRDYKTEPITELITESADSARSASELVRKLPVAGVRAPASSLMAKHPYTIRLTRPDEENVAFAVERQVWAPFNWLAEGGVGADYDPEMHLLAVDENDEVVANIDAFAFAWDGDPATLPVEGWRDAILAANAAAATERVTQPRYACAHGASILESARGGGLAGDMLVALRDQAFSLGYEGVVAPVRPTARARMPHLSIDEYLQVRLPDGRHFDPWLRVHEAVGGRIIATTERSMYWWGEREQWEEWTGLRLPDNGSVLIDGSIGWLELVDGFGELVEDSVWVLHPPSIE